jgi:hypothetical protein
MNDIENVWKRILDNCSEDKLTLKSIFKTKRKKSFYIIMIDTENIKPCLLINNNEEWIISKSQILDDLVEGHPKENENVNSYKSTATSYRYGLLHDDRIYKTI